MQTAQLANTLYAAHNRDLRDAHVTNSSDATLGARLTWLALAIDASERRARLFRTSREEREARLMRRPLTTAQAFARFGLLLGTLPPASIFIRLFLLFNHGEQLAVLAFMFPMLLACAAIGRFMAKRLGSRFDEHEHGRGSWLKTISVALGYAIIWAAATGTVGGAIFFIIGGIFGFACALPVALVAFALFVPLHRLLARGGMIDARHFQPLAWGINLTIAALILSPQVIPY
jgi:hypothetical protein